MSVRALRPASTPVGRVEGVVADTDAISRVLADGYGLAGARLQRVLSGVATVNFVADADDGYRVFVKAYQPEADLATERAAIELSEFAGTRGVPTARVVWSVHGEHVHEDEQVAVSVWEFVAADGVENAGLACLQMMAVGTAVGRLRRGRSKGSWALCAAAQRSMRTSMRGRPKCCGGGTR